MKLAKTPHASWWDRMPGASAPFGKDEALIALGRRSQVNLVEIKVCFNALCRIAPRFGAENQVQKLLT